MTVVPRKRSLLDHVIQPLSYLTTPVPDEPTLELEEENDPFRYGWRGYEEVLPNGKTVFKRKPLTLYDVLHPLEGDFRLHSRFHEATCNYLFNAFENQLHDDPTAVALLDVRIAWQAQGIEPHTPDISVIVGVQDTTINWSTFDEATEGTRPSLVVEITSPSTRHIDLDDKFREYALAGLAYYIIVDTPRRHTPVGRRLLAYELVGRRYVALQPNAQGWLWLPTVELWLGLEGTEVRCYDSAGQRVDSYNEVFRQAKSAQARADAEAQAKREAQARADAEAQAKREAQAQAEAEAQAKRELEARLAEMEAELRRLRGNH